MKTYYEKIVEQATPYLPTVRRFYDTLRSSSDYVPGTELGRFYLNFYVDKLRQAPSYGLLVAASLEAARRLEKEFGDNITYYNALHDPRLRPGTELLIRVLGSEALAVTSMVSAFHVLLHERHGKRVYDVSPELGEALQHTEVRGLLAEDLRLPYPAVYVTVPRSLNLRLWNQISGWHVCEGVFLYEDVSIVGSAKQTAIIPDGFLGKTQRCLRVLFIGEDKTVVGDDALEFFNMALYDGLTLDECIEWGKREVQWCVDNKVSAWNEAMVSIWPELFRWVMNALIYATHGHPGEHVMLNKTARQLWERIQKLPSKSPRTRELRKRFAQMNPQRRMMLTVVRRGAQSAPGAELGATGSSNSPRVCRRVAGHWKRIVFGTGRQDRKLGWIEPYWRNEDIGPEEHARHVLR